MLGKPEWFKRRKYSGWGISPKTWQGWAYLAALFIPFAAFQALPYWSVDARIYITAVWLAFVALDVTHIMVSLHRDEREHKIEALSERNAAWAMALILAGGIVYEAISSALQQKLEVDLFLVAALFGGMIIKTASNIFLERAELQ